jgi:hypothetical protein
VFFTFILLEAVKVVAQLLSAAEFGGTVRQGLYHQKRSLVSMLKRDAAGLTEILLMALADLLHDFEEEIAGAGVPRRGRRR